ncbi:hypothetical protein [Entomobacter blattae]|uniref:Uncharacterized protein n=1 Tax=Entomobacter blattae TaxID=2762277 RepID=A0A7H1NV00_9PROT|nr:hypothetical protein [Entomobacter blattae]QNT79610.1 hypothetical protein JGUZn3_24100 [Entomobacter blattae]
MAEFFLSVAVLVLHMGVIGVMAPLYVGFKRFLESWFLRGVQTPISGRWAEFFSAYYGGDHTAQMMEIKERKIPIFAAVLSMPAFLSLVSMFAAWALLPSFSIGMVTASLSSFLTIIGLVIISRLLGVWGVHSAVNTVKLSVLFFLKDSVWIMVTAFLVTAIFMNLYGTESVAWCLQQMKEYGFLPDNFAFQVLIAISLLLVIVQPLSLSGKSLSGKSGSGKFGEDILESFSGRSWFFMAYKADLEQLFWVTLIGDMVVAPTLIGMPAVFSGVGLVQWLIGLGFAIIVFVVRTFFAALVLVILQQLLVLFHGSGRRNGYISALLGGITLLLTWGVH